MFLRRYCIAALRVFMVFCVLPTAVASNQRCVEFKFLDFYSALVSKVLTPAPGVTLDLGKLIDFSPATLLFCFSKNLTRVVFTLWATPDPAPVQIKKNYSCSAPVPFHIDTLLPESIPVLRLLLTSLRTSSLQFSC